ncbi:Ras-related protein Rab7 [Apostasia shenzhenica]|uniref:Ras-related protein Rab7 n=1 Tax=Apostasia shenzhenica TaxID=1088818 RepID=A0A2I0AU59_9ASPA|nr:Ras-related protein Rab7 [Apostasia shenzhenica]
MASRGRMLLNVIILGDSGYVNKKFSNQCKAAIGVDFLTKEIQVDERLFTLQKLFQQVFCLGNSVSSHLEKTGFRQQKKAWCASKEYFESSANEGFNVEAAFSCITKNALKNEPEDELHAEFDGKEVFGWFSHWGQNLEGAQNRTNESITHQLVADVARSHLSVLGRGAITTSRPNAAAAASVSIGMFTARARMATYGRSFEKALKTTTAIPLIHNSTPTFYTTSKAHQIAVPSPLPAEGNLTASKYSVVLRSSWKLPAACGRHVARARTSDGFLTVLDNSCN